MGELAQNFQDEYGKIQADTLFRGRQEDINQKNVALDRMLNASSTFGNLAQGPLQIPYAIDQANLADWYNS